MATPLLRPSTARWALAAALLLAAPRAAPGCPICRSETGRQVRARMLDQGFVSTMLQTLAPFPVFLGIVAAIRFGGAPRARTTPGGDGSGAGAATPTEGSP